MGYEFSGSQNQIFDEAAKWINIVGIAVGIGAIFGILGAVSNSNFVGIVPEVVDLVVAFFLITTSKAFKNITTTKGNDIEHAMEALKSLRGYFFIQAGAILIAIVTSFI